MRGLGVLRDHVAAVDARVRGQERRQPVAAGLVEEPVGAPLADRGDVGRDDREEVEHVGHRRPVEVAVGLDPALLGQHDRVVDGRGELAAGDGGGVLDGVAGGAVHLRASSAGSRRPGRGCSRGRGARPPRRSRAAAASGWPPTAPGRPAGRIACSSGAKTRSVASWPSTDIAAAMSAVRSSIRRSVIASTSMPSMPSVPLISASPSLAASSTGARPAAARASAAGISVPVGVAHVALAHQRQRAVGQRRQVAGAAERAVLAHHRRDAGRQQPGQQPRGLDADPGVPGRQRRQSQQHQARAPPRARPRGRSPRRASGPATSAAARASRPGCGGWRGRRTPSRSRTPAWAPPPAPPPPPGPARWRPRRRRSAPPGRRREPPGRRRRIVSGPTSTITGATAVSIVVDMPSSNSRRTPRGRGRARDHVSDARLARHRWSEQGAPWDRYRRRRERCGCCGSSPASPSRPRSTGSCARAGWRGARRTTCCGP